MFLFTLLVLATPVSVGATISVTTYPGGLAIATCDSPKDIFSPDDPIGEVGVTDTSAGLFCLTGIIFKLFYSSVILVGIAFFLVILIGGLKYLTAGGDDKSIQSAQKALTYGITGFGIALGSVFFMIIIVGKVLQPMEITLDPLGHPVGTTTPDPLHVLIPDYFCTTEGINDSRVLRGYCNKR